LVKTAEYAVDVVVVVVVVVVENDGFANCTTRRK